MPKLTSEKSARQLRGHYCWWTWAGLCVYHGHHTPQPPLRRLGKGSSCTECYPLPGGTSDRRPRLNYRTAKCLVPKLSPTYSQKSSQDREEGGRGLEMRVEVWIRRSESRPCGAGLYSQKLLPLGCAHSAELHWPGLAGHPAGYRESKSV